MQEQYTETQGLKIGLYILMAGGLISIAVGFVMDPERTWANVLLNNYYFLALTVGATFFLALQFITQSGWSALFMRIPMAIGVYFPVAAVSILLLFFGMESLYHWSISELRAEDVMMAHKYPYLNVPYFFIRLIIFFGLWIFLTRLLRRIALTERPEADGTRFYNRSEFYSKVYIFVLAVTFSLATFDLIMSIDVHWFSTIFAVKNFVSGFYHSIALVLLIVILLNKNGYLEGLNNDHLRDFAKYLLILGIIWAYLWFVQYLLIWFANIPEETIYFVTRTEGSWRVLFFSDIILNFGIPFLLLFSGKLTKSRSVLMVICVVLLVGLWIDLYIQIMPGSVGERHLGFVEFGSFLGFLALFTFIVSKGLSRFPLIQANHPYLKESINHHRE